MATRPWKMAYRAAALESNKALLEKRITRSAKMYS